MSLYTRSIRPSFGMRKKVEVQKGEGLSIVLYDSPLSHFYVAPIRKPDTKALHSYLVSVQTKRYGKTLDIPVPATLCHIKQALSKHSPEYVCRAIRYASTISYYPFSIPGALRWFNEIGKQFDDGPRPYKGSNYGPTNIVALWD